MSIPFVIPNLCLRFSLHAAPCYVSSIRRFRSSLLSPLQLKGPYRGRARSQGHALSGPVPFFRKLLTILKRSYRLKENARQQGCDTIVSFITMPNIMALFSKVLFNRRVRVVVNVHDTTSRILQQSNITKFEQVVLRLLIRGSYRRSDAIVAIAEGIKQDLIQSFGIPPRKILVIHNPADIQMIRRRACEPISHPWFTRRAGLLLVAAGW